VSEAADLQDGWDEDDVILFLWGKKGGSGKACSEGAGAHRVLGGLEGWSYRKPRHRISASTIYIAQQFSYCRDVSTMTSRF